MFQQIEQPFMNYSYSDPSYMEFTTNYVEYEKKDDSNLRWILAILLFIGGIVGLVIWKIKEDKTKQAKLEEDDLNEDV